VASNKREPLHLSNANWYEDRISVAADPAMLTAVTSERYADRHFGNAWSWTPDAGAAVYGRSDSVPRGPSDRGGPILRVPFRRIPIIELNSLEEALAFGANNASHDPRVTGMWRGQPQHYPLPRDPLDKLRLYGESDVNEPSLLPSAGRRSIYFPDVAEAWCGLLDLYIEERLAAFALTETQTRLRELRREAENFASGYNYRAWALATAQHYGLPSVGLDLTSDIQVALYFALNRIVMDPNTGVISVHRVSAAEDPIIYGLGVFEYDLLEDEKLAPAWLTCARPRAQKAFFFGSAWGDSVNAAADRVYIAARLKNHSAWQCPITTEQAFPSTGDDTFLAFLLRAKERFREPMMADLLRQIYFRAP